MNLSPLGRRLIVELQNQEDKKEEITKSGIILSKKSDSVTFYRVVKVSKEISDIKEGNLVLLNDFRRTPISIEGKDYLIISYDDILAVKD